MKDKKWVDCPVCGETNSMIFKTDVSENLNIKDYGNLKINNIEGYYCKNCKDGILTRKSQNYINAAIAEFKAKKDAEVTVAADLISVDEMAKKLKLSRQSIHKMMNIGKIRYVFVGDIRLPLKNQKVSNK